MPTGSPSSTAIARHAAAHRPLAIVVLRAAILVSALAAHNARGQTSGEVSTVDRVQVRELIVLLESNTRADRTRAERDLLALGPAALQFLPAPELLPTISVKQAVRRIRVTLEHQAAEESVKASTVTLKGKMPLSELIGQLSRQTRNGISLTQLTTLQLKRPLSVDWNETPFWAAIREVESAGFMFRFSAESGELGIVPATDANTGSREVILSSFRVRAGSVMSRVLSADDAEAVLKCPLTIECEPRLRPLLLRLKTNDFQLKSSDGNVIAPFNPDGQIELPLGDGGREARTEVVFLSNRAADPQPLTLTGMARVLTAALEQPIVFRDLEDASGTARRRGGVTVTLRKVTRGRDRTGRPFSLIEARVGYDVGANAFESHQTWVFHNRAFLESKSGDRLTPNGFETIFQGDGSVGVVYRFSGAGDNLADMKFVYMAPTLLINVPLKIEIDGLGLAEDAKRP